MEDSKQKAGNDAPNHPAEFQKQFCVYCRNPYCQHAEWAVDKFSARIVTQPDRFFKPTQLDPENPQFSHLKDFMEITKEVLQIHMANQDDWDVEVPITDGVDKTASEGTTNAIDEAAKALAKSKNKELNIPEPEKEVEDKFSEIPGEVTNPDEILAILDEPEPTIDEPKKEPEAQDAPAPSRDLGNTENPKHGIMIGGDNRPEIIPDDPWAPPSPGKEKKVEPGAKIIMGGKGTDK